MTAPSPPPDPAGLLLCRDLIFTAKVVGTAEAQGYRVATVGGVARAVELLGSGRPKALFLDLTAGDLAAPEAIATYRRLAPDAKLVAFGPHVDTAALQAAADAGCDTVLPRSRFSGDLPALLERFLGDDGR